MADLRTLACIGLNGFDRARLRLLLGEANPRLEAVWQLGQPEAADLLLLAEGSAEAEAAGMLARGRGVRCVRLGSAASSGEEALPSGFDIDDLVRVLSTASAPSPTFRSLDATTPEFFEMPAVADAHPEPGIPEAVDLERYFRRDSAEYTLENIVPYALQEDTSIEPVQREHVSSRAEVRGIARNPYAQRVSAPAPSPQMFVHEPAAVSRSMSPDRRPLAEFLDGELLMAPSQIVREGAEPLILDPKNRMYMIVGDLVSADAYARAQFAESDFERLTTRELERWRALCEARPYLRLQWLLALRRGDGWLPRHLDPGGSYRVRRMLDLDAYFDDQIRIGQVLQDWHRLHEVSAQAGVDMQSVFNTIAAFDAIGWLETRPRERLR